jgi:hypothetical protein
MNCVSAHRVANPEKYSVSDAVRKLYPAYDGLESRMKSTTVHLQVYAGTPHAPFQRFLLSRIILDTAHVIPMMLIAMFITNMPPTAALKKHKSPPLLLQTPDLTPGETVLSPVALLPAAEDDPLTSAPPSVPTNPTHFLHMTPFRRGSSLFLQPSKRTSVGHEDEHMDLLARDPGIYHGGWVSILHSSSTHSLNPHRCRQKP